MENKMKKIIIAAVFMLVACSKTDTSPTPTPAPTPTPIPVPTVSSFIPDGWKALESFNETRFCAVAETVGEKIYVGLGYNGNGFSTVTNDWYEYDIGTNKWTKKQTFPGDARANAVSFSINGKIYVGLGTNYNRNNKEQVFTDLFEYDPATDKWSAKADFPSEGRDQPVFFTIANKGYVGTGNTIPSSAESVKSDFWEYDPATNKWAAKEDFPTRARCRAFGFAIGNKGYLGGGEDLNVNKLSDFFEYDPATNTWNKKLPISVAVSRSRGFSFNGAGYVVGGLLGTSNTNSNIVYKFDQIANEWTKISEIATNDDTFRGRLYPIATVTKTKAYIGLGAYGNSDNIRNQKDFYEYLPK
jgi:N-acetylneuraminic acid mutarotase